MPEKYSQQDVESLESLAGRRSFRKEAKVEASNFDQLFNLPIEGEENFTYDLPALEWRNADIDVEDYLNRRQESMVEAAGPTVSGYELLDADKLQQPIFTSNVQDGLYILTPVDEMRRIAKVDFVADGAEMSLADESIGAFFASCVPDLSAGQIGLRFRMIAEASRTLKRGGFLFWQGGRKEDIAKALDAGFVPVRAVVHPAREVGYSPTYSVVFQKTVQLSL